jgi:hypothetical protein
MQLPAAPDLPALPIAERSFCQLETFPLRRVRTRRHLLLLVTWVCCRRNATDINGCRKSPAATLL